MALASLVCAAVLALAGGPESAASRFDLHGEGEADLERRLAALDADGKDPDAAQQEDPKPQHPQEPLAPPAQESSSLVEWDWWELIPRAGLAFFSGKYHINASPAIEIEARAPVTFLAPASNPDGDYFGVWAQINMAPIKRTIVPTLAKASGLMASLGLGVDYTILRDDTWLLLARLGLEYTTYGGVTDLNDGGQVVVGFTAGLSLSRSIVLTATPEIMYAKTGDYILLGMVGLALNF